MNARVFVGSVTVATLGLVAACDPRVVDAVAGAEGGAGNCAGDCCSPDAPDRDGDGVPNCADQCPDQPDKSAHGVCGCDIPDEDRPDVAGCLGIVRALVHRYAFDGTGAVALDTAGLVYGAIKPGSPPANGAIINASLDGSGRLSLPGGTNVNSDADRYVSLPPHLLSVRTSVTIEAWLTWYGGEAWQRIFDFGNNDADSVGVGLSNGTSYLFLTPSTSGFMGGRARIAYKSPQYLEEVFVDSKRLFPTGIETHIAVTFDGATSTLSLYLDGVLEGSVSQAEVVPGVSPELGLIEDEFDWIGRSQYAIDDKLNASIDELRIYSEPFTEAQIRTSAAAGPNPFFFEPR
jgi:hypothetical protein